MNLEKPVSFLCFGYQICNEILPNVDISANRNKTDVGCGVFTLVDLICDGFEEKNRL